MPWQVSYDAASRIVQVVYEGDITPGELHEAVGTAMRMGLAQDCGRILTDCTRMRDGHSAFDLYAALDVVGGCGLAARIREAVLLPDSATAADNVHFWETACQNRGIDTRAFRDRDEALAWLTRP